MMQVAQPPARKSLDRTYALTTDVDTAAARLRRHCDFVTTEALNKLRNSCNGQGHRLPALLTISIRSGRPRRAVFTGWAATGVGGIILS